MYGDNFEKAFAYMLENEGGFVNDEDDKGGATKYGISLWLMKSMFKQGSIWLDLHRDGQIDEEDVMELSLDDAKKIYHDEFWVKGIDRIADIDLDIGIKLFDTAVNLGVNKAIKVFQSMFGDVKVDGIIGPQTRDRLQGYMRMSNGRAIVASAFCNQINDYYEKICENNPSQRKFLYGWRKRAFRTPDLVEKSA